MSEPAQSEKNSAVITPPSAGPAGVEPQIRGRARLTLSIAGGHQQGHRRGQQPLIGTQPPAVWATPATGKCPTEKDSPKVAAAVSVWLRLDSIRDEVIKARCSWFTTHPGPSLAHPLFWWQKNTWTYPWANERSGRADHLVRVRTQGSLGWGRPISNPTFDSAPR